ncbi:MAG: efflux RND transporter periplasmic adaptor subunit [Planctomycetota bacterium]|jgi:RND family efflux transporter MFP subunit
MTDQSTINETSLAGLRIDRGRRVSGPRRGWVVLVVVLILVAGTSAGAAYWYYQTTGKNIVAALGEKAVDVNLLVVPETAEDEQGEAVVLVANGRIVSDVRVNVATKVSGQIIELNVEQGDEVEKDQVLARIEDVIYRAQRDEAQASVVRARHAIGRAEAEAARARAVVAQAVAELAIDRYNFERLQRLRGTADATDFEFVNSKNKYESAQAAVEVAQAAADSAIMAVEMARADLDAAQAALVFSQKRFDDSTIRAPIGGVILERNAQLGDFLAAEGGRGANANAQLVAIADMALLRVEIDVSERDVHRLRPGQSARVTPDAAKDRTYDGSIMWIDPIGDYAKATVGAKVRVLNPGPDLRVEGSAKVELLSDSGSVKSGENGSQTGKQHSLWLPKSAVKLDPGSDSAIVFTVTADRRAKSLTITLGAKSDKMVEVLSELTPGSRIVGDTAEALVDGQLVRVVNTLTIDQLR